MSEGANVNEKDENGRTPLHDATQYGELGVIGMVMLLIHNGANVNGGDNDGCTPLQLAVEGNHIERARAMIQHIILHNPEAEKPGYITQEDKPQLFKFWDDCKNEVLKMQKPGNERILDLLRDPYKNIANGNVSLHEFIFECYLTKLAVWLSNTGLWQTLEEIIREYPNIAYGSGIDHQFEEIYNKRRRTLLHYAADSGNVEMVKTLINNGANVNEKNDQGHTPLHTANYWNGAAYLNSLTSGIVHNNINCWDGKLDISRLLINNGANLNERDNDGYTPLQMAIGFDRIECAKAITQHILLHNPEAEKPNKAELCDIWDRESEVLDELYKFWDDCKNEVLKMQKPGNERILDLLRNIDKKIANSNVSLREFLFEHDANKLADWLSNTGLRQELEEIIRGIHSAGR
nr:ankyrin repeat domain-containing protein [Wolbachia endosymbiont of Ctenocephalides felis wCfeT]